MALEIYKTKVKKLAGTSYGEVYSKARFIYKTISSKTKRRPYIRSVFFGKEKIFLDYFWHHLMEKNSNDRFRRLKLYACGIDLIKNSHIKPIIRNNPNRQNEIFYRFVGLDSNNEMFYVQIKEDTKSGEKSMISVFPED